MSTHTQPCEYELCKCTVRGAVEGASYCSEICRSRDTTGEMTEENCECAHPACDAE